jgi:ATP-dependent DNA helicase RecQ
LSETAKPETARVVAVAVAMPDVDEALRDYLREWRRNTARAQGSPAFVVMHDTTLEELCRKQPKSIRELLQISGFGERKAQMYGPQIFAALEKFRNGERASAAAKPVSRPAAATKRLLEEGQSLAEVATIRGRQISTIVNTIAELVESGEMQFKTGWVDPDKQKEIQAACERLGTGALRPIKDVVSAEITYDDIRLVAARLRWEAARGKKAMG